MIFDFERLRTNRSYLCAERASHLTVKSNDEKELLTRSPPQTDRKMPAETFWCNFSGFGPHLRYNVQPSSLQPIPPALHQQLEPNRSCRETPNTLGAHPIVSGRVKSAARGFPKEQRRPREPIENSRARDY